MTFDASGFFGRLSRARVGVLTALPDAVEQMGLSAVLGPPAYGEPDEGETGEGGWGGAPGIAESERMDVPALNAVGSMSVDVYTVYHWRLGHPNTTDCPDCIALAEGGPYTAETLPTTPGAGDTECGDLCHCSLEPADVPWLDEPGRVISAGTDVITQTLVEAWGTA